MRFLPYIKYPYDDMIDYSGISVFIDEKDIMHRDVNIVDVLQEIPQARIESYQQAIARAAVALQYSEVGSSVETSHYDAVVMALYELHRHVYGLALTNDDKSHEEL